MEVVLNLAKSIIGSVPLALAVLLMAGVAPEAFAAAQLDSSEESRVLEERVRHTCWDVVGDDILSGVHAGARSIRGLSEHDREDVISRALEKAWKALSLDQLSSPRAWGRAIARNTALDMLRRRNADPLAGSEDISAPELQSHALYDTTTPEEIVAGTQLTGLRSVVESWPSADRDLAMAILDGDAKTITAAAKSVRDREIAAGITSNMYPAKARTLLQSHCTELVGFHDLMNG